VFIHRRLLPNGQPVGPARLNILPSDSITYDDEIAQNYPAPQQQTTSADDEDEDSNYEYDDDIDYNIRDPEEEDDDDEDDNEDEAEEDDEEDEEDDDDEDDLADLQVDTEADIKEYVTKQQGFESKGAKSSTPMSSPSFTSTNKSFQTQTTPSPASSSVGSKPTPSPNRMSVPHRSPASAGFASTLSPSGNKQTSSTPQSSNKAPTIFTPCKFFPVYLFDYYSTFRILLNSTSTFFCSS
jgi:hypothetical protein